MEDPTFPIPNLPNELIIEILTWLPVKPLLKFKCVCKSWRALISTPRFVKAHLENSKSDRNFTSQRLLMQRGSTRHNRGKTLSLFKQLSANSMLHEPVSEAFNLSSPFLFDDRRKKVLGSCNGLLCLAVINLRIKLILWNPSTRIRKELPDFEPSPCPYWDHDPENYGFGYDKLSDDYKVVRFFGGDTDPSEPKGMLQVYSLRNDQWKTAKPLGLLPLHMFCPATLVSGKLYWIASHLVEPEDEDMFVVCFDLEMEEYEILQLPNGIWLRRTNQTWLLECGGSLRLMVFLNSGSDVWSLDDCGVGNENWAKVARVPSVEDEYCFCVLYVMNSLVLFLDEGSFAIFDAKDGSIRYHNIRKKRKKKKSKTSNFRVCSAYIESLVSPLG